jgi:serine/threonine protein kinase
MHAVQTFQVSIGTVVARRYWVLRLIASGSFSTVWLCIDLHKRTLCGLKVMHRHEFGDSLGINEALVLDTLHKVTPDAAADHLVRSDRTGWLVHPETGLRHRYLELWPLGMDLFVTAGRQRVPVMIVKRIARELLHALALLHDAHVIHTDLKPENILLTESGPTLVRLIDLGNACWRFHKPTGTIGTLEYRAPEVVVGMEWDTSVDIWALACVLFELLTGSPLFDPRAFMNASISGSSRVISLRERHLALMAQKLGALPDDMQHKSGLYTSSGVLRHIPDLEEVPLEWSMIQIHGMDFQEAVDAACFLRPMLEYIPHYRARVIDCLRHPWLDEVESLCSCQIKL